MKNKKNVIIVSMLAIVAVMAIGYSYFATRLNINATGNITTNWNVYFSNITNGTVVGTASNNKTPSVTATTASMDVNLQLPGDSMTYELTLTNGGTIGAIIEDIKAEAKGSSAIIYSISGLKIGDKLASGASKTITIKIEYNPNTTSQPALTNKTLTVTINAVQDIGQTITESDVVIEEKTLAARILKENTAQSDSNIDFSKSSEEDGTKGLYYTNINTEDSKTTYYFRGAVENNYVKFGSIENGSCTYNGKEVNNYNYSEEEMNETACSSITSFCYYGGNYFYGMSEFECVEDQGGVMINETPSWITTNYDIIWRIVRINEDGSIRLVKHKYDGFTLYESVMFNESGSVLGYMYGNSQSDNYEDTHANINNSTVKEYLDNWYIANLSSYSSLLADTGFCNDRSMAISAGLWHEDDTALGYGMNTTYYGAYNRLVNLKQPQFACPQSNDLFTLKDSSKGNKALDYPIGLITADEVAYAGGAADKDNNSYYLENGNQWWTMSPFKETSYDGSCIWTNSGMYSFSVFGYIPFDSSMEARPVINLKSNVEFTLEGTGVAGSSTNPYIIKTN